MHKENVNSKISLNKSKDLKDKIFLNKESKNLNKSTSLEKTTSVDKSITRKSTNIGLAFGNNSSKQNLFITNKRKTVSPNITAVIPKNSAINSHNANDLPPMAEKLSPLLPNKRKYYEYAAEVLEEKNDFTKFEKSILNIYIEYESNMRNWNENFFNLYKTEFLVDELTHVPRSLSNVGSKILNSQKFWIMWIEVTREKLNIDKLIGLFNQCFNYITEESLLKAYYLKTMKNLPREELNIYIKSRNYNYDQDKSEITNQMLFNLLESYAQFLLRSTSKLTAASEEKKIKISSSTSLKFPCQNIEITINSVKKEFFNIKISNNENNFFISKNLTKINKLNPSQYVDAAVGDSLCMSNNKLSEKNSDIDQILPSPGIINKSEIKTNQIKENSDKKEVSFITPIKLEDIRESNENQFPKSNININSNSKSEWNDHVEPLTCLTQKTDCMIVSQNTSNRQMEFIINLNNSHNLSIISQTEDRDKYSLNVNYTQDTLYNQNISVNEENCGIDNNSQSITNQETSKSRKENFECINKSSNHNHIISLYNDSCSTEEKILADVEDSNSNRNISDDYIQEDISKKKLEEERFDVIDELSQNILEPTLGRASIHNLNASFTSNKSASKSRSRSRGRGYASLLTEEYPNNLVEGSIRTFNKSFNGCFESSTKPKYPDSSALKENSIKNSHFSKN